MRVDWRIWKWWVPMVWVTAMDEVTPLPQPRAAITREARRLGAPRERD